MSKIKNFATTNAQEIDLEDVEKKGDTSRIALIKKNRISAISGLNKAVDSLEETVSRLPVDGLVIKNNDKKTFNLQQALRETLSGLQNVLTSIESSNSLEDLIVYDLSSSIKNMDQVAASNWQTGASLQILIEVLKEKNVLTDDNLKEAWDKIIPGVVEQMKKDAKKS